MFLLAESVCSDCFGAIGAKLEPPLIYYAPIYVRIYENRAYNNNNSLGLFQDNTQAFHSMTHRP